MEPSELLAQMGGTATYRRLVARTGRAALRKAVADGSVLRLEHGRYALPETAASLGLAQRVGGVVALRSAAVAYGWKVKTVPQVPEIAVRAGNTRVRGRADLRPVWTDLAETDVRGGVTSPLRTVVDAARRLPFDEALAIADSALRAGDVSEAELAAVGPRGRGAARVRRVLAAADRRAANPFESMLRALCLDAGLSVVPQQGVAASGIVFHPDLTCLDKGVLIEADSFTFHSGRDAFRLDCERYNSYTLAGWRLVRFTYEQVAGGQAEVARVLAKVAALPSAAHGELAGTLVGTSEAGPHRP